MNIILISEYLSFIRILLALQLVQQIYSKISSGRFEFYLDHLELPKRKRLKSDNSTAPSREVQLKSTMLPRVNLCCNPNSWIPFNGCTIYCRPFLSVCLSLTTKMNLPDIDNRAQCELANSQKIQTNVLKLVNGVYEGLVDEHYLDIDGTWPEEFVISLSINHRTEINDTLLLDRISHKHDNSQNLKEWNIVDMIKKEDYKVRIGYRFVCQKGSYGKQCTEKCEPRNSLLLGHYQCEKETGRKICLDGWQGANCNQPKCSRPCTNGRCVQPDVCKCNPGWKGPTCDECISSKDCQNGFCEIENEPFSGGLRKKPFTCQCMSGWTGLNCDIDLRFCVRNKNICQNGKCVNRIENSFNKNNNASHPYECSCQPGFTGKHCELMKRDCKYHGCSKRGACQIETGKCECLYGYYGDFCEFHQKSCDENPCQGASSKCESISPAVKEETFEGNIHFHCVCEAGREGRNCERITDKCQPYNPCMNNGLCANVDNGYKCICTKGYTGPQCQIFINTCDKLNCLNGGKCIDSVKHVSCECPNGWTGQRCEENINECELENICLNGGSCRDLLGSYSCQCVKPFHGNNCELLLKSYGLEETGQSLSMTNSVAGVVRDDRTTSKFIYYVTFFLSLTLPVLAMSLIVILIYLLLKRIRKNQIEGDKYVFSQSQATNNNSQQFFNEFTPARRHRSKFDLNNKQFGSNYSCSQINLRKLSLIDNALEYNCDMTEEDKIGKNEKLIRINDQSCIIIDKNFLSLPKTKNSQFYDMNQKKSIISIFNEEIM